MLILALACAPNPPAARAVWIESLTDTIGGPKAVARPGDILLENGRLRATILGPRYSLGPSIYGGTLADLDIQRSDPRWAAGHGNDQLAEMFATVDLNLAAADDPSEVFILADGSDGGAAIVRVDAADDPFLSVLGLLWDLSSISHPDLRITTDYILEPDAEVIKIRTTATIVAADSDVVPGSDLAEATLITGSDEPVSVLDLAMGTGLAFGDFYLQGGSIDVFAPGIGFDEERAVYEATLLGRNLFLDPLQFPFVGGTGDGVSYGLAAATGSLFVPLFTSSQTAAFGAGKVGDGSDSRFPIGSALSYERYIAVGEGDMGSVYDRLARARGESVGAVRGWVLEAGTGSPVSGVSVFAFPRGEAAPFVQWETDVGDDTQPDGSFGGSLPPGEWDLAVHLRGWPEGERVPVTIGGDEVSVTLSLPRTGRVEVEVEDEWGRPLPAKVSFFSPDADLRPDLGDPFIGGDPAEVRYLPEGFADIDLPPGQWTAIATRGMEYEIDSVEFDVAASGSTKLHFSLPRSVDSEGWVSADFHVHSAPSFDSGVTLENRVATMVCEGVDYFTSTDHDAVTDFAPTVDALGLEPWIGTGIGIETTTLEIGHFIGFPVAHDFSAEQGGSYDWTGMTPADIFLALDELGIAAGTDPVTMVAHPRDGILGYFDQYGFSPYTGELSTPTLSLPYSLAHPDSQLVWDFDAIELLNGKRFDFLRSPTQTELSAFGVDPASVSAYAFAERTVAEQEALIAGTEQLGYGLEGQIDDWFTMLNLGIRIPAVGNSDSHSSYSIEAGCPRNYVESPTDEPGQLDDQAIADAVKAGKSFMTYGPFLRFWIDDPENSLGSEVTTQGEVTLHIEVEASSWMAMDRVEIYQNGTLIDVLDEMDEGIVRLIADRTVTVDRDSWFVIIAMGDGDMAPLFTEVELPPVQLQDVVVEALSDVPAVASLLGGVLPVPRTGPVFPYALTNPIYVDLGGDGWTAPGLPAWLKEPEDPAE